jgi:hypothetical protein
MIKKFVTYIGQIPWEVEMERQERILNRGCWAIIILAAIYFGPICVQIFLK